MKHAKRVRQKGSPLPVNQQSKKTPAPAPVNPIFCDDSIDEDFRDVIAGLSSGDVDGTGAICWQWSEELRREVECSSISAKVLLLPFIRRLAKQDRAAVADIYERWGRSLCNLAGLRRDRERSALKIQKDSAALEQGETPPSQTEDFRKKADALIAIIYKRRLLARGKQAAADWELVQDRANEAILAALRIYPAEVPLRGDGESLSETQALSDAENYRRLARQMERFATQSLMKRTLLKVVSRRQNLPVSKKGGVR